MSTYATYTDEQLLKLLKDSDEAAFTQLYHKYWHRLYQSAYKKLHDREKSRDVIQNVFASLWDRREVQVIDNCNAYLYGAVRFAVLKELSRLPGPALFAGSFAELITAPERADGPLLEKEIRELLRLFIEALPEKRRIIFLRRYAENYTTGEIATQLGISRKTVQNQLNTAELALRARLAHFISIATVAAVFYQP